MEDSEEIIHVDIILIVICILKVFTLKGTQSAGAHAH